MNKTVKISEDNFDRLLDVASSWRFEDRKDVTIDDVLSVLLDQEESIVVGTIPG